MTAATTLTALIADTFRESFARKIFWGFWGCSTLIILLLLIVLNIDIVEGSIAGMRIFGQEVTNDGQAIEVENFVKMALAGLATGLFSIVLFLAIFASAGLIPTVFQQGRIELLLSKPVSRSQLLLGKYLGAWLVVACNIAYLVVGAWAALGIQSGIWNVSFLASGVLAIFAFGVILTVVLFVAVVSNSAVLSSMVAYVTLLIGAIVSQHEQMAPLFSSQWPRDVVSGLYYVLPKIFEIGDIARRLVMERGIESWMPFWSSGLFALAALTGSVWMFQRKDY